MSGTKGMINCTEMERPTHPFPYDSNEIPSAKSLPCAHYLESNINDYDIETGHMGWWADFKIKGGPSEALPSSSSVRGFTFFLMEGLRGIFNNSFRTVCVLFHSIWYSHSNNVSIFLILDVTNDILYFHLLCFKLLDRSFYIWMDLM